MANKDDNDNGRDDLPMAPAIHISCPHGIVVGCEIICENCGHPCDDHVTLLSITECSGTFNYLDGDVELCDCTMFNGTAS